MTIEDRGMPAGLEDYLLKRQADRAAAVGTMLGVLTDRERVLVKEAAVMGYVQGRRVSGGQKLAEERFPKDDEILRMVLDASRTFRDLHPNLAALDGES